MVRVIRHNHWLRWCSKKGLDLNAALFSLDSCYYGAGFRSRPGTLAVFSDSIVHHSYSVRDTLWAFGESSIRIDVPFADVVTICKQQMPFWLRIAQLDPQARIRITMNDGVVHDFFLQRYFAAFEDVLRTLGHELASTA